MTTYYIKQKIKELRKKGEEILVKNTITVFGVELDFSEHYSMRLKMIWTKLKTGYILQTKNL